jgi:hypothetical protein
VGAREVSTCLREVLLFELGQAECDDLGVAGWVLGLRHAARAERECESRDQQLTGVVIVLCLFGCIDGARRGITPRGVQDVTLPLNRRWLI